MHAWLRDNRYLGPYLRNWEDGRGISLRAKVLALVYLWVSLAVSAWLMPVWWARFFLLFPGVYATIYLLRARTLPDAE